MYPHTKIWWYLPREFSSYIRVTTTMRSNAKSQLVGNDTLHLSNCDGENKINEATGCIPSRNIPCH